MQFDFEVWFSYWNLLYQRHRNKGGSYPKGVMASDPRSVVDVLTTRN